MKEYKLNGEIILVNEYPSQIDTQRNNLIELVKTIKKGSKVQSNKKKSNFAIGYKAVYEMEYSNLKLDILAIFVKYLNSNLQIEQILEMFNISGQKFADIVTDLINEGYLKVNNDQLEVA